MTTTTTAPSAAPVRRGAGVARVGSNRDILRLVGRATWITALMLFVLAPIVAVLGASLSTASYWEFPPRSLTLDRYRQFFDDDALVRSAVVSLSTATFSAVVGTTLSLLAAVGIARTRVGNRSPVQVVALLPVLVPHLALGVAIFGLYIRWGVRINIITLGAAQLIVVLPVTIILLVSALGAVPVNVERAAADLGASAAQVFLRVTLPLIKPTIIAAAVLAFIRSFDESSIALFVNSPDTVTLPVRMLIQMEHESGPLIAAAGSILVLVAVALAVVLDRTIGLAKAFGITDKET